MAQEETASRHAEQQAMRDRLRKRLNEIKLSVASGDLHPCKIRRVEGATAAESDSKFSLTDYDSDGGEEPSSGSDSDSDGPTTEGGDDFTFDERKIFYCSRTHTQLSQFVNEVKRTKYASDLQLVCLASRKQLCINTSVNSLGSVNKMNDKCLDLIKSNGCPFYTDAEGQSLFRDHVLAQVQDIEELVSLGKKLLCCPYYGTRMAIKPAQLVVLPYQILFYNQTRDWLGINLNENVVVIDEAHNLADAINSIYSVELNLAQIECAHTQLTQYLDRYQTRLNAKNMVYIKQILYIIAALTTALSSGTQTGIKSINDFIFDLKIDNYNFWKLERYFQRSDIVHKVMGFCDKVIPQTSDVPSTDDDLIGRHRPALGQVENFLLALTNADRDGRILITINAQNKQASSIRFLLLNPEAHFADVIEQSKATILAGGTLQPMSTFKLQLMDKKVLKQITEFSCGHVIPPSNLLLVPLCEGPTGSSFELNFSTRSAPNVMHDLGRALSNLCSIVPDGVVCFFPSYSYLEEVMRYWEHTGVKSQIARKKELFTEPTDSNAVELVLRKYRAAIDTSFPVEGSPNKPRGAVLCAVVGGKMSEGINFSDGMARCVIMVGMPYPNIKDPILAEKMKYIKERSISASIPDASSQFYEDTCMKAVNQSIGRAIRHAQDYAVIILADVRYTRPAVQSKLPHWMQDRILTPKTNIPGMPSRPPKFGESFAAVAQFFRNKKPHQVALEEMRRNKRATHTSTVTKNS
ncbi:ATP-dependent DNA helicase DDX11 [Pelomyxa schiedti]|nr:ATP-dependent DNA helicase DDX11 [Pelomyxa schiedti]